jgi:hypothetical protein
MLDVKAASQFTDPLREYKCADVRGRHKKTPAAAGEW